MNIHDFFPNLPQSIHEVDLNKEAILYLKELSILDTNNSWKMPNPLIKSEECEKFIQWVHRKYNCEFSYGGYGENRSVLWHGTYLDNFNTYYHLGVDINIPAGTILHSPISGRVVLSDCDSEYPSAPQEHGWGNRLIIDPEIGQYLLILAHLSDSTKRKIDSIVQKGEKLGTIGRSTENGGWFEHFHIQAITRTRFQELWNNGNIPELDGYAMNMDIDTINTYPNPFNTF